MVFAGKDKKLARQSLQYRATITGLLNVGVYTAISLTGRVYNVVMGYYDPITRARLQPWSASIMLLGSVASLFVFVGRNTTLMTSIKSLCSKLKQRLTNKVSDTSALNYKASPAAQPVGSVNTLAAHHQNVPLMAAHGLPEVEI